MVRSFMSFITISYFTLSLWNLFFWLCSLRKLAALVRSQSQKTPSPQISVSKLFMFMWFECLREFIFTAIYAALRVAVQAFCREEKSHSNHSSKRKREGFDQVTHYHLLNHIDLSRLITRDLHFHKFRRDTHLVTQLILIVQGTEPIISLLLWQIEL